MNILLITGDQWRGECLSALAHPCLRTPHLDALAADGVLFERHYSQATPCGPARASLLTGMYLHHHRVVANGTPLDRRFTNLALELRRGGFATALFGYTDTAADPRGLPTDDPRLRDPEQILPGFDDVVPLTHDFRGWFEYLRDRGYRFEQPGLALFEPDASCAGSGGRGRTFAPSRYRAEHSHNAYLTDHAIDWIRDQCAPWFVHLTYLSPHPPFLAPAPYHARYSADEVPAPVRAATLVKEAASHPYLGFYLYNQSGWAYTFGADAAAHGLLPDHEIRQARATYYGMISEVDDQIGRLLEFLRARGEYDNTLIVFTSDHGELLGDHWQFSKYSYFDQAFHVPMILKPAGGPASTAGTRVALFTGHVDVMPTILTLAGLAVPRQCDGASLSPFVEGDPPADWREAVTFEFDFRGLASDGRTQSRVLGLAPARCAVACRRGERYKYVHFAGLPALYFDLQNDPSELHDLSRDPENRPCMIEHAQALLSDRMRQSDEVLAGTRITPDGIVVYR